MSNVTTNLGSEAGIQYTGVEDHSIVPTTPVPNNCVIVGLFRLGHFEKEMKITLKNIKQKLGYDPNNPYYQLVEDALKAGAPVVKVFRQIPYKQEPELPNANQEISDWRQFA